MQITDYNLKIKDYKYFKFSSDNNELITDCNDNELQLTKQIYTVLFCHFYKNYKFLSLTTNKALAKLCQEL